MVNSGSKTLPAAQREATEHSSDNVPKQVRVDCFDDAVALQFVTGRITGDLRPALQEHLIDCEVCRARVNRVAHQWAQSSSPLPEEVSSWGSARMPRGLMLAQRYRVDRFVARGGMGEVYEVHDTVLGERIALKTVTPSQGSNAEAIAQLKAEVQLARRVSHKNVCRIYDLGTHTADDAVVLFLTMEYVEGISLAEHLRTEGKVPVPQALELATKILEGLQAAHEAGVLHRDLKSDNIMLRAGSGGLSPVVMDFGLASALNPNSSRVSSDHALVGSLSYMAPEQVQGEPLRVATDLYAFGVVFFEMLTGRLPFEASTPALSAIKRLQERAPRLRSVDESLPLALDKLVGRCLERDPKARYASARQILIELGHAQEVSSAQPSLPGLAQESSAARPIPRQHAKGSWLYRQRAALVAGVVGVLFLAAWWGSQRNDPVQSAASTTEAAAAEAASAPGATGESVASAGSELANFPVHPGPTGTSSPPGAATLDSASPALGAAASSGNPQGEAQTSKNTGQKPPARVQPASTAPAAPPAAGGTAHDVVPTAGPSSTPPAASSAAAVPCPVGLLCPKRLSDRVPAPSAP